MREVAAAVFACVYLHTNKCLRPSRPWSRLFPVNTNNLCLRRAKFRTRAPSPERSECVLELSCPRISRSGDPAIRDLATRSQKLLCDLKGLLRSSRDPVSLRCVCLNTCYAGVGWRSEWRSERDPESNCDSVSQKCDPAAIPGNCVRSRLRLNLATQSRPAPAESRAIRISI